jgi:heme A synthase
MKIVPNLFRITSAVIFIQLLLGGLLTFSFIDPTAHIITGFIVFILAVATMVVVFTSKPSFPPLRGISIGMVALIIIQIILGFEILRSGNGGSQILPWVHFAVAMGIYGMAVAGSFMAFTWSNMARAHVSSQVQQQRENQKV